MEKNKIEILIACHKRSRVFSNNIYVPIHVGKALHPNIDLGYIGDDTGENISKFNPYYCELTAQYWGWKNIHNKYIGLCHYRRYFKNEITNSNIDDLMSDCDIILAPKVHLNRSLHDHWMSNLCPESLIIFYDVMKNNFSDDYDGIVSYFSGNCYSPFNMFICEKKLFDKFAEWEFNILQEVQRRLPVLPYSMENRFLGYMAETLLSYYAKKMDFKVKYADVVDMIGPNSKNTLNQTVLMKILNKCRYFITSYHTKKKIASIQDISSPWMVGLKNDGLI